MTLKDFCTIANAYYAIDCAIDDCTVNNHMHKVVQVAYNKLSDEDKHTVNTLCDARLTDFL